jgi:Mg/Co/Ni transporter MgtE
MLKDPTRSIRDLLTRTPSTALSNILMRIPDKVCAAAFSALSKDAQRRLFALIGETKANRIREEIRIETRRRTSAVTRTRLLRSFLSYFEHPRPGAPTVWVRPIRRRENR